MLSSLASAGARGQSSQDPTAQWTRQRIRGLKGRSIIPGLRVEVVEVVEPYLSLCWTRPAQRVPSRAVPRRRAIQREASTLGVPMHMVLKHAAADWYRRISLSLSLSLSLSPSPSLPLSHPVLRGVAPCCPRATTTTSHAGTCAARQPRLSICWGAKV
jgi:hypothetical protein